MLDVLNTPFIEGLIKKTHVITWCVMVITHCYHWAALRGESDYYNNKKPDSYVL